MRKLLALLAFVCASASAGPPQLYTNSTVYDSWILLGGPQQPYRAGLVLQQAVPMAVGDVALVVAEGEGSIYRYPFGSGIYTFPLFVTSQMWVYGPGNKPPPITLLGQMGAGIPISPAMGMDISQATNYYSPVTRTAAFKASVSGTHTFTMYWWGGSSDPGVGTGNSAVIYPGTAKITVIVMQ